MSMTEKFERLASQIEADAAGIRRRAKSGASAASQRIMASEAAALERSARRIRDELAAVMAANDDVAA